MKCIEGVLVIFLLFMWIGFPAALLGVGVTGYFPARANWAAASGQNVLACRRAGNFSSNKGFCLDYYVLSGPWSPSYPLHACTPVATMEEIEAFIGAETWPCYAADDPLTYDSIIAINRTQFGQDAVAGPIALIAMALIMFVVFTLAIAWLVYQWRKMH